MTPDLDLHCARVNASAEALGLDPVLPTQEIVALAQEGLSRFADDAAVYIRPMVWAEESDAGTVPPLGSSSAFALCLEAIPMAPPTGFTVTTTSFRRPTLEVMPVNAKAACLYPNNARMMREAKAKGFNNAIVCDTLGNVAETATSNIFLARGGEVSHRCRTGNFGRHHAQALIGLLREAGVSVHDDAQDRGIPIADEDFDRQHVEGDADRRLRQPKAAGRRSWQRRARSTGTGPTPDLRPSNVKGEKPMATVRC